MNRPSKHLARPDWWTAFFSGIVAVTALGALWYARDQIAETRQESEQQLEHSHKENQVQLEQSHKEDQIQHLMAMVREFDHDPMARYRRELAKKRLAGKPSDPLEMYRELDFFETVDLLVERDYLSEEDVWNQFRWWVFDLNADKAVKEGLDHEQHKDRNEYSGFISLVERLRRIDKEHHGTGSDPTPQDVMDFYREESQIVSGEK